MIPAKSKPTIPQKVNPPHATRRNPGKHGAFPISTPLFVKANVTTFSVKSLDLGTEFAYTITVSGTQMKGGTEMKVMVVHGGGLEGAILEVWEDSQGNYLVTVGTYNLTLEGGDMFGLNYHPMHWAAASPDGLMEFVEV